MLQITIRIKSFWKEIEINTTSLIPESNYVRIQVWVQDLHPHSFRLLFQPPRFPLIIQVSGSELCEGSSLGWATQGPKQAINHDRPLLPKSCTDWITCRRAVPPKWLHHCWQAYKHCFHCKELRPRHSKTERWKDDGRQSEKTKQRRSLRKKRDNNCHLKVNY